VSLPTPALSRIVAPDRGDQGLEGGSIAREEAQNRGLALASRHGGGDRVVLGVVRLGRRPQRPADQGCRRERPSGIRHRRRHFSRRERWSQRHPGRRRNGYLSLLAGRQCLTRMKAGFTGGLGLHADGVRLDGQPLDDRDLRGRCSSLLGQPRGGIARLAVDPIDLLQPGPGSRLHLFARDGARAVPAERMLGGVLGRALDPRIRDGLRLVRGAQVRVIRPLRLAQPVGNAVRLLLHPFGQRAELGHGSPLGRAWP
jgi:hypothetical protein